MVDFFTCENRKGFQEFLRVIEKFILIISQGLTNGEAVVIYKHPDDARVFGQYTFKDERCLYETVYYYVQNGKYEFTSE